MRSILLFLGLTISFLAVAAGLLVVIAHNGNPAPPRKTPEPWFAEEVNPRPAARPFVAAPQPVRPAPRPGPVFRPPVAPTPEQVTAFRAVFDSLRQALADSDEEALATLFDFDRLTRELEQSGLFDSLPGGDTPGNRADFTRGLKAGFTRALTANALMRWERTDVRRVQLSADGREAVVTARHRSAALGNRTHKMRWWLVRGPEDWYVYDLEDLDMGTRISRVMASSVPAAFREHRADPARFHLATAAIQEALVACAFRQDVDEADEKLEAARGVSLPPPIASLREMVEGIILAGRGEPESALKRLDEAERLQPDSPALRALRATFLLAVGRNEDALRYADRYLADIGPDPDALTVRGAALEGLGRTPEAAEAYRQALDELPDLLDAIQGLRRVLPDDRKRELAVRVERAADPLAAYDGLYWDAVREKDDATVRVLKAWLRKARPDDPRAIRAEINDLVERGDAAEAGAVLRGRLASGLGDELKQTALHSFVFAMVEADRHLEAYAVVPDDHAEAAFRLLAQNLDVRPVFLPPNPADRTVALRRDLAALHRKRRPGDPWLLYYEGSTLVDEGRLVEAERKFAAAEAALPPAPEPENPDPDEFEEGWTVNRVRAARVNCLFEMKEGLRAYAEVGPPEATFARLAPAYYWDKDAAGLEALVAAHRENRPKDRQLLYWSAELLDLRGKHAEAAAAFLRFAEDGDAGEPNRWSAMRKAVSGYLRAGRPGEAQKAVVTIGHDKVSAGLRAAVHLANDRADLAEEILAAQAKTRGGYQWLYYDEDFTRQMNRDGFESLRRKYPDTRKTLTADPPG